MNRHNITAFIACMGLGLTFMNVAPILPRLGALYGVDNAAIAFLATSIALTHAAVQIPAGILTDRFGMKNTLVVSLGVIILANLLSMINSTYLLVVVMRLVSGVGTGFVFCAGIKYATVYTAEKHRGSAQGVFGGSFSLGATLPFFAMPVLMDLDWRLVYGGPALFLMFPLAFMLVWGKEVRAGAPIRFTNLRRVLTARPIWTLGGLHAVFYGSFMTLGVWFSAFATSSTGGLSLQEAGFWGAVMMLVSGLARFMGGFFLHRVSPRRMLQYSAVALLLVFILLTQANHLYSVLLLLLVAFYASSVTFGAIFNLSSRVSNIDLAGTGFGVVNFIANLGGLCFPIAFGYLLDLTGAFDVSFIFMAILAVCGIGMTAYLRIGSDSSHLILAVAPQRSQDTACESYEEK